MEEITSRTLALAESLLCNAKSQETHAELAASKKLGRMLDDAPGRALTFEMVDQVFRSHKSAAQAKRWRDLIEDFGFPAYPPATERGLMRLGAAASNILPGVVMPAVARQMRKETAGVILPGERDKLDTYLKKRKESGFRINLNQLGEAVLGEEEAAHRLASVLEHLQNPLVDYISVKISSIFSQINLTAWSESLCIIKSRLRRLYRAAMPLNKFVNLDMEEFRDLALTRAAFQEVLDEPEFHNLSAGIVLQAYLPDSWPAQQALTEWAKARVAAGGAPVKLRLVKGANLAMEAVEAELHDWTSAPYPTKADTDANFRRMLEFACQPENAAAVKLGVASHNLFDAALALVLREVNGVVDRVELEMLEGMANHQARAARDEAGGLLLYAPAVKEQDFLSAMAYLVRRLDENTADENFLRDMFAMEPGSAAWENQKQRFLTGWEERKTVSAESRRNTIHTANDTSLSHLEFHNTSDSDWTHPDVRAELSQALASWQKNPKPQLQELDALLETAQSAQVSWEALNVEARGKLVRHAGEVMSEQRFQAIACMRATSRKSISEADGEVSEAIDFANYYAGQFEIPSDCEAKAFGVVVIAPPWNFPYAIPCGGILAALMAGNSVILKPAPETVEIAWLLAQQLWEAGIPRDVVQFFPCSDGDTGRALITDPRVASVILTGAYETARLFQGWRPSLRLFAETSGKNALIVTGQADRELAIKDLVKSAFGHSGQKCSAASLAILEGEVYDDPEFRRQLRDAAASLPCGPSTDPRSVITPLILEPRESLLRALTQLDSGEEWLLEPKRISETDPCQWSPGIRLGVKPGSWFHKTECFGPVLGLMKVSSLAEAIQWQNATDYGLTAGIHSLDEKEVDQWRDSVQAGNLYINRPITGAIVQRQPFGGWKRSSIGPGAKAGGPNYIYSFCDIRSLSSNAEDDYQAAWENHFSKTHDPTGLRCESNGFRYRPSKGVILRLAAADETILKRCKKLASIAGVPLEISLATEESEAALIERLPSLAKNAEFFRTVEMPSDEILAAVHAANLNWINAPVTHRGRLELRFWLREQAVSETRHRYGRIVD